MKTLVIAQRKGGVGKTTIAVHLAWYFAEQGVKVALLDLDTQENATFVLDAYRSGVTASQLLEHDLPQDIDLFTTDMLTLIAADQQLLELEKSTLRDKSPAFAHGLDRLQGKGVDLCIIDTPPALGIAMASALAVSDYVLTPIELEAFSISGIAKMIGVIRNLQKANPNLRFLGVVPSRLEARSPRHQQHLKELRDKHPQLVSPCAIGVRGSLADAVASRLPVWQIKKTAAKKAASEMRALALWVGTQIELEVTHEHH